MQAIAFANLINMSDVGMIERRRGLRLANKAIHAVTIGSKLSRKELQRDLAIELGVLCEIHLTHPARANLRADFIAAKFRAGGDWHPERPGGGRSTQRD